MEKIRLAEASIDGDAARLLGHDYALQYSALPLGLENGFLRVAMSAPDNLNIITHLADITGHFIMPVHAEEKDIRFYINKLLGGDAIESIESQFLVDERRDFAENFSEISPETMAKVNAAPIVRFLDSLIEAGVINRASDIHIEPFEQHLRARYRVDGALVTYSLVDISMLASVISRLKIMGGMDISEKRLPQDGYFSMLVSSKGENGKKSERIDFRLSTLPTFFGEKAVIRLLYAKKDLKKTELGFYQNDLECLTELFTRPHGAIFITGPTGSGKSTTLNCFLEELNSETLNIVTVEDPVENPIQGVSHVRVERSAGLNFAGALRHILRQDPDIIMIGEIRDEETARIAIQAAITGHVVLSTLHTNDAAGVIERLLDMGIEPYLAAAALNGVISQRLVRRICWECSAPAVLSPRQARLLNLPGNTGVRQGKGCAHCNFTGLHSRFAVYEYIVMDENKRRKMSTSPAEFAAELRKNGGLRKNALRSLSDGRTTADEIIRILSHDSLGKC